MRMEFFPGIWIRTDAIMISPIGLDFPLAPRNSLRLSTKSGRDSGLASSGLITSVPVTRCSPSAFSLQSVRLQGEGHERSKRKPQRPRKRLVPVTNGLRKILLVLPIEKKPPTGFEPVSTVYETAALPTELRRQNFLTQNPKFVSGMIPKKTHRGNAQEKAFRRRSCLG